MAAVIGPAPLQLSPEWPHERGGGGYISLSDCAAPDVSSCGALLCVFRISAASDHRFLLTD